MDTTGGALSFEATLQYQDLRRSVDEIERRIKGMTSTVVGETDKIDNQFKRLGQLAAGYFTLSALGDFARQIVTVRGEFQQLEIAFNTMLRSKAKADALLAEAVEFAAKTPFNLKDVANGAKQLLAYGSSAKSVISELRVLGDVAAGTSTPIGDLVYLYGTLRSQGRAYAVDIRQFAGRGIPIYAELAKVLGVNVDKVNDFVTAGKVGFKEVEQAFKNMTSGTGLFAGTLDAQSKSVTGLISNLKDAYDVMLNNIGAANQGIIVEIISGASTVVQNYEPILDILKVLVATYGTYKAAVIAASVAQSAATVAGNVNAWLQLASGIRSAKDAQIAFNLATSINPYVAAITVIAALVTTYAVYSRELTGAAKANETLSEARDKANSGIAAEMAKIDVLRQSINNEKLSREQRNKALKDLIALSPQHLSALTLDSVKTADGTRAIEDYISAKKRQIELQSIEKDLTDSIVRQNEAKAGKNDLGFFYKLSIAAASAGGEGSFNAEKATAIQRKKINDQAIANEEAFQAKIKERINAINEASSAGVKAEGKVQAAQKKTVEYYDAQIKALKEEQSAQSTTRAQFDAYQKQIDAAERAKRRVTGEVTAEEKRQAKAADKVGPYGSITYWENIAKKAEEIIGKTPSTDTAKLTRQTNIKLDAEKKAEDIRKRYAVKSFDEELNEKRNKYELYQKWVDAYGKKAADAQFGALVQSGQSYLDYLNAQIAKLEAKRDKPLSESDAQNLGNLITQRDEITGKKTGIELFNESLQQAQKESGSLAEYLVKLKQKQEDLGKIKPFTKADFDIRRQLAEEVVSTQAALQNILQQFLVSFASSGEQQLAIQKEYAEKRAALDAKYNDKKSADYIQALGVINEAEKKAFQEFQQRKLEETQEYKNTTKIILEEGRKGLKIQIQNQQALVDKAKEQFGENSEPYKAAKKRLTELKDSLNSDTAAAINQYATIATKFGDALIAMGGDAASAGQLLGGLASGIGLVTEAFDAVSKKNAEKGIQIAIQSTVELISIITNSAAQRKKTESEYYASVIAQQQQYNLLLNEQIGLRTQEKENIFVKDYVGEINDAADKYEDAQAKYQESMRKLAKGQAKVGLKESVDWNAVGAGVTAGAALGTIVPGVGNVVGAVVGGIVGGLVGLFGGKKNKDEFGKLLERYPDLIRKSKDGVDELNTSLAQTLISQNLVDDATKELLQSTIDWQKQMDAAKDAIKSIVSALASGLGDNLRDSLVNAFAEGTDSALAFKGTLETILQDFVTKLLFSKVFTPYFDQLEKDITASLLPGGDGTPVDDFAKFFKDAAPAMDLFNKSLQQFQDQAKANGFDVLQKAATSTTKNPNSISGVIQAQVTEATANVLTGQINAMRITTADTNLQIRQSLIFLSGIERNTGKTADNTAYLEEINRSLKTLASNPTRGLGQPG